MIKDGTREESGSPSHRLQRLVTIHAVSYIIIAAITIVIEILIHLFRSDIHPRFSHSGRNRTGF